MWQNLPVVWLVFPVVLFFIGLSSRVATAQCERAPTLAVDYHVTIDVADVDIQNVLRLFADQGDVNFVLEDGIEARLTLRLRDVPLSEALVIILCSQGLTFEQFDNLLYIHQLGVP